MLEKAALVVIILSGIIYCTKGIYQHIICRRAAKKFAKNFLEVFYELSSVPTEIKKPKTKKKGK